MAQQDRRTFAPGTSLVAWQPLGAWSIAGVRIDNRSGSWLRIDAADMYVPPYTIGWQRTLTVEQQSISVLSVTGPAGKQSTPQGSLSTATIFDVPIPDADGTKFIDTLQNPTSLKGAGIALTAVVGGTGVLAFPFIPATPGLVIPRLYSATLAYDLLTPSAVGASSPVLVYLFPPQIPASQPLAVLEITPAKPSDTFYWPAQGIDLGIAETVLYNAIALDTDMNINLAIMFAEL